MLNLGFHDTRVLITGASWLRALKGFAFFFGIAGVCCEGFKGLGFAGSVFAFGTASILGGSWVVINGLISRVTILLSHIRGLITPLRTTHEPPSNPEP